MTKNIFLIAFLFSTLFFTSQGATIKGTMTNASQIKYAYLFEFFGSDLIKKDSAKISDNKFQFQKKEGFPRGFYQIKFDDKSFFNLILGNENINVSGDLANLASTVKIADSKENELYNSFKSFVEIQNIQMKNLQTEANSAQALQNSDPAAFQIKMTQLQSRYDSIFLNQQNFYKNLAEQNKGLYIAKFVDQLSLKPEQTKDNYLTTGDFKDEELLRSDVLISKISQFFSQKFTEQSLEGYQASADALINKSVGTKGQEIVFLTLINMFGSIDMEFTRIIAEKYVKAFPKSEKPTKILASMPKPSPGVGEEAPNILLPDPDGKNIALSSLKGQIVLLDFWASWCGPCRMENPNVVNVFNKYKDKGFIIYSVSLDNDRNKWLAAIEKDKMTWLHVSDLKNWNSAGAALYGVRSIPATYLIGKDGKIIAKNLRGEKLEQELKKVLEIN
jgi:thiol-disulfide isomerase/thioredoxin